MKTILSLVLLLSSGAAHADAMHNLIEARKSPGFERNPQTRTLRVREDGQMTLEVISHRENKRVVKNLGKLSHDGLARTLLGY